jgi:hypothetical protein
MKEVLLLNGNAKLKTKVMLFIKFSCVAAYDRPEFMSKLWLWQRTDVFYAFSLPALAIQRTVIKLILGLRNLVDLHARKHL